MKLKGKTAVITGGALGIGAAFAKGFASEGANVVIADLADGSAVITEIKNMGGRAIAVATDVSRETDCLKTAEAANEAFGSVDILVNNAGIFSGIVMKPFMEVSLDEWNRVMAVNVGGAFNCIKAVFPYMKDRGGKIINVVSGSYYEGVPGFPHYVSSKAALMGLTRGLARELGEYNININSLAPGFTLSGGGREVAKNQRYPKIPLSRIVGQRSLDHDQVPEDLVGTAVFLAGPDSDTMTGQVLLNNCGVAFN
jgi:NAD(P)-dependent dehydrogenase (short-subunit alcohol dehydrogenase family)